MPKTAFRRCYLMLKNIISLSRLRSLWEKPWISAKLEVEDDVETFYNAKKESQSVFREKNCR